MKGIIIAGIIAAATVAVPSQGAIMKLSQAEGVPGGGVELQLTIAPRDYVTDFRCTIRYDTDLLAVDRVSITDDAWNNGIHRIRYWKTTQGQLYIESDTFFPETNLKKISDLATIEFVISSAASPTVAYVDFVNSPYYEVNNSGNLTSAGKENGQVIIRETLPTPVPTPRPRVPELSLGMESTEVLIYGERPVLEYNLEANGYSGTATDAYLAVRLPNGEFFYLAPHNRFKTRREPIVRNFVIGNRGGFVALIPLGESLPVGTYTFYATLAYPGSNPFLSVDRYTAIEDTHFELVVPSPPSPRSE